MQADDTYVENAWKHAEMDEIENLAAECLGKAQEAQSIEDDLFCLLEADARPPRLSRFGLRPLRPQLVQERAGDQIYVAALASLEL